MSFNPQVTFDDAGGDCPHTIKLAASQAIRVYSVAVEWDGSGAGGSFHPCCSIYSQDGKLLSRTRPEQIFAGGDSGVVTYAPFLHSEPEAAPVTVGGPMFEVDNQDGADEWSDLWYVALGAASSVRVTTNPPDTFYLVPAKLSPDGLRIAFTYAPTLNNELWVMDVDGSNQAMLDAGPIQGMEWLDETTIVYQRQTVSLERIDRDGSNQATIAGGLNLSGFNVCPSRAQLAYVTNPGAALQLHVVDADGSNDTTIVADMLSPFGAFAPSWRLDGGGILFNYNGGVATVAPDGSGLTVEVAVLPNAFWYPVGMSADRFFLTDRSIFAQWRLAQIVFGVGYSIVAPTLYLRRNVHQAAPTVAQGRVFAVQDGSLMGGVDSLVSVLPDGSDLTAAFVPDESGAPLFQAVTLV